MPAELGTENSIVHRVASQLDYGIAGSQRRSLSGSTNCSQVNGQLGFPADLRI